MQPDQPPNRIPDFPRPATRVSDAAESKTGHVDFQVRTSLREGTSAAVHALGQM